MVGETQPPVNASKPGSSPSSDLSGVSSEVPKVSAQQASTLSAASAPPPAAESGATPTSAPQPDSAAASTKPSVAESQGESAPAKGDAGDGLTKASERTIPPLPPDADELLKVRRKSS